MLECSTGRFELGRYPRRADETLQAWDAADEFILRQLEDRGETIRNLLVVNDNGGRCIGDEPQEPLLRWSTQTP